MANFERTRQLIAGQFGPDEFKQQLEAGWKPVAIEWEREIAAEASAHTAPAAAASTPAMASAEPLFRSSRCCPA
jgi:hypothetical protein